MTEVSVRGSLPNKQYFQTTTTGQLLVATNKFRKSVLRSDKCHCRVRSQQMKCCLTLRDENTAGGQMTTKKDTTEQTICYCVVHSYRRRCTVQRNDVYDGHKSSIQC